MRKCEIANRPCELLERKEELLTLAVTEKVEAQRRERFYSALSNFLFLVIGILSAIIIGLLETAK